MKFTLFLLPILSIAALPSGPSARNAESSRLAIRKAKAAPELFVARQDSSPPPYTGSPPDTGSPGDGTTPDDGSPPSRLLSRDSIPSLVTRQGGNGQGGGSGGSGGSSPPDDGAGNGQGGSSGGLGSLGRLFRRFPQGPGSGCICKVYGDCSGCTSPGCACPCEEYEC